MLHCSTAVRLFARFHLCIMLRTVLDTTAAAMAHSEADSLAPLVHALAALAAGHVARTTATMARVPTMWAALGAPPPTAPAKGLPTLRLRALVAFTAHVAGVLVLHYACSNDVYNGHSAGGRRAMQRGAG